MRILHLLPVAATVLAAPLPLLAQAPLPIPVRAEVMVLGSWHMGGSSDHVATTPDDILARRRQAELEELVARLAAYNPTRIVVEVPVAQDSALNAAYREYVAGRRPLARHEHEQIGFRLARRLRLPAVHAVDHSLGEDIRGVMAYAGRTGQSEFLTLMGAYMQWIGAESARRQQLPVLDHLREINSAGADSLEALYLLVAPLGAHDGHVGAELVSGRMTRNLKIFANIAQVAMPGDRILVIYGSSHGKLLRQFFAESPAFRLVDVAPYLAPAGAQ